MEEEIIVQPITNKKELKNGFLLVEKTYDTIFAKDSILTPEEKVLLDDYRRTKLQKLLTISNRQDAFFIKNKEKISFIASHQDEKEPTRIILDGAFLRQGKSDVKIIPVMLGYLCTKYPAVTEFWTAILKKNEPSSKVFISQGFVHSDYMDTLHPDIFQGWKRKIEK